MIGIIGAMQIEVDAIKQQLTKTKEIKIGSITFVVGEYNNQEFVIAQCGIGKVFAAICAQTMIMHFNPKYILNIGVGGSLSKNLNVGYIAISSALVQHDMDTSPLGDPKGLISGINVIEIPADKGLINKIEQAVKKASINYEIGVIGSGDQFINSVEKKDFIKKTFNAIACDMEGAAIAQVCYVNNVPFAAIRAISDNADGKSHVDYSDFIQIAVNNTLKVFSNLY